MTESSGRRLPPNFLEDLTMGFLKGLLQQVHEDKDLDLHIRENYLNIYFKGNSLLKLSEVANRVYRVEVHPKFLGELNFPPLRDEATASTFVAAIPGLKTAIIKHGASSLEIEYEQLLILANNLEPRTNSEYFIVDRQYAVGADRFDLIGLWWPREGRQREQEVAPCFIEIKFAQNTDIAHVAEQLHRYYDAVAKKPEKIAQEIQNLWNQRLQLGLFKQPVDRLEAMATLKVSEQLDKFQFIVVLIDYNPHSTLFDPAALAALPFSGQVRLFRTGFAMWQVESPPGFYVSPV